MDGQRINVQHFHQLRVHAFAELTVFIQDVGKTARHARAKVHAGFTQDAHNSARHVFTAVIADAFHHGDGAGVTHRKTFARTARGKQTTAGCAVQTGIADDARFMAAEG